MGISNSVYHICQEFTMTQFKRRCFGCSHSYGGILSFLIRTPSFTTYHHHLKIYLFNTQIVNRVCSAGPHNYLSWFSSVEGFNGMPNAEYISQSSFEDILNYAVYWRKLAYFRKESGIQQSPPHILLNSISFLFLPLFLPLSYRQLLSNYADFYLPNFRYRPGILFLTLQDKSLWKHNEKWEQSGWLMMLQWGKIDMKQR